MTTSLAARPLATAIVLLTAWASLTGALAQPVAGAQATAQADAAAEWAGQFDAALVEYERNHWPQAFAALSALADRGHPEAARMALQMWRYGPALYRLEFLATSRQVETWARAWGCGVDAASESGSSVNNDPRLCSTNP